LHEVTLDSTDRRILAHLQENGRASNLELADAARLSPAQSNRRHRRLEEQGLIRRYEARLNAEALGLGVTAFVHVTMERGHMRELAKFRSFVQSLPQVQECYAVTGDFDYVLKVVARDLKALSDFLPGRDQVHQCLAFARRSLKPAGLRRCLSCWTRELRSRW
jgi:Lrp/AsnC family transcriptional regulator, leucine-responsive regulatory protein